MKKRFIFLIISMLAICFECSVFAESDFALSNLIIRQDGQSSSIYWVNNEKISELEITDNKTGTALDLSSVSFDKGAINVLEAPLPQTEEELLEYKIVCNGKTVTFQSEQVQVSSSTYGALNSDSWSVGVQQSNLCASEITEVSANKALHFTRYGNATVWFSGTVKSGYEAKKTYKFSFDYKGKNAREISVLFGGNGKKISLTDTDEWTTYTEIITTKSSSSTQLMIPIKGADADIMIDNVSIYLYEDENITGENLVLNGDFEGSQPPQAILGLKAEGCEGGAKFSWQEADCKGYLLTIDDNDPIFLDKSTTEYTLSGIKDDTLVTATLKVKGNNGLWSEEVQKSTLTGILNVPVPDQSSYQPKFVIARNENGSFVMTWKNPKIAPSSAAVYRLTGDKEEYIEATYNLAANAVTSISLGGAATDYYKLKLKFNDGTVMENFATIRNVGYWEIHHNWQESNEANTWRRSYHLTDENPHGGKFSYHMLKADDKKGHLLYRGDTSSIEPGTYRLGFWYRGSDYTSINVMFETEKTVSCTPSYDKWNYVETDYTITNPSPQLTFKMNQRPDVFIDDVTLYKVENGVTAGENLINNGDFETVSGFSGIKNYTYKTGDSKVDLSWELPGSADCAGVSVYVNNQHKGNFFTGKTDVTIGGLINGLKNNIRLVTINVSGSPIGESVEFTVVPKAEKYKIDEFILKKDGKRVAGLSEGTFTVETTVKNNQTDAMDATLVTAVYVDGEMLPLVTDSDKVAEKGNSETILSTSFTITTDMLEKDIEAKNFVIDSLSGKQALSGKVVFK